MDTEFTIVRTQTSTVGVVSIEKEIAECRSRLVDFRRLLSTALEDHRRIVEDWRQWFESNASVVTWFDVTRRSLKSCLCKAGPLNAVYLVCVDSVERER